MFDLCSDYDPPIPSNGELLAVIGLDNRAIRDALADDRVRRCSDHEVPADRSLEGRERRVNSRGPERGIDPAFGRSEPNVIIESTKEIVMGFGLNCAEGIGRLGADGTVNHLVSGGRVANLSIATDESDIDR